MKMNRRREPPRLADLSALETLGEGELCVDGFCAVPPAEAIADAPEDAPGQGPTNETGEVDRVTANEEAER